MASKALAVKATTAVATPAKQLSSDELAARLGPSRPGDFLGTGAERPPPPPDPDAYDLAREEREFARSALTPKQKKTLEEKIAREGYLTIEKVREMVEANIAKGSAEYGIDPELMLLIDTQTNYKTYVAEDNIYTREELYATFPFQELNAQPEAFFLQQEVGIFPPKRTAMKQDLEYIARDVGDETIDLVMLEDMVGARARKDYKLKRPPMKIVKTKVYVGRELWEDFLTMARTLRATIRIAAVANPGPMGPMLGGVAGPALLLQDAATLEAEKAAWAEEVQRREAELKRREEEARIREEETRKRDEENQRKIDEDMKRIRALYDEMAKMSQEVKRAATHARAAPPAKSQTNGTPTVEDDSVPL